MEGSDAQLHRLRRKLDCFMQYGWAELEDIALIESSSQDHRNAEVRNRIGATSTALAAECNQSNLAISGQFKDEDPSNILSVDKRAEIENRLHTLRPLIIANSANVESSYKRYRHLQYKLRLMLIARSLQSIASSQNILQIPNLVLDSISQSNVIIILQKSKLFQYALDVVRLKKTKLLLKFHRLFEETLDSENDANDNEDDPTSISSTAQSQQQNNQQQMWERFLRLSREWLLAYTMVSLLPAALSRASSQTFRERFKDALDEAMTPLWGRFYHHLKLGRESGSWQQMLWTFGYARSFMTMLTTLCSQITRAPEMASMLGNGIDMNDTAKDQILEKVMKFLYAHVAALLVIVSTEVADNNNSDSNLSQLVEEILDFDMWKDAEYNQSELKHLIEIVYESKPSFHAWLMIEHELLFAHFHNDVAKDIKQPYQLKFKPFSSSELDTKNEKGNRHQCYIAIYDCLQLFLLLQQRFQHLPSAAQMIMAEVILEPLLCLSLGLLLYRVRADSELFDISIGSHHLEDPSVSWHDFHDTVTYFHKAMLHQFQDNLKHFKADSARCRKRWTILQNWMPQKYIDSSLQSQRYSIQDMIRIALKVPEKYRDHRGYAYRSTLNNGMSMALQAIADDEDHTLASCVLLTDTLATTILAVMEKQLLGT